MIEALCVTEKISCGRCEFLLYWGEAIALRLFMRFSEEKLLQRYGRVCPNCGAALTLNSVTVEVK
jgi:ribosomal protein S27AE